VRGPRASYNRSMRRVTVGLPGRQYDILIGAGLLDQAADHIAPLAPTRIALVSDTHVAALYGERLAAALERVAPVLAVTLQAGEPSKRWDSVREVLDALVDGGADRRSVVMALGGGVVGDIAGFAAAVFMRGIRLVQVPTTLLAQVDSSVGGKTGINHPRGKNLIGAFHQPQLVLSDTGTLGTLPPRELSAGLAEVLKHGLLADAGYFEATARELPALRRGDADALARAIARSCEIKAGIVERDERESGERALLNFGHTFGHAIEALTGYDTWLHGEAVGCGMVLAADLSQRVGLLDRAALEPIAAAIDAAGLPMRIPGLSADAAIGSMRGDKKSAAGEIRFILLERVGHAVQRPAPEAALRATLAAGGYS
jgi:3-dehydroquinate synthase